MTENQVEDQPQLLTLDEAVQVLRISPATLYKMMRDGSIVTVKFGRRTLIERTELERVIAAHRAVVAQFSPVVRIASRP